MRFLNSINSLRPSRFARSTVANATSRAVGGTFGSLGAVPNSMDLERDVVARYERSRWVFRCVDSIATKTSHLPIIFRDGGKTDAFPTTNEDDLDRILNKRANTYETGSSFRYRVSTLALLSPKGVFIEKIRSRAGGLLELQILPPHRVEPIPDPQKYVAGYRVQNDEFGMQELLPEQVLWLKLKPHPLNPYAQMTPLMAAGLTVDTHLLADMFNFNFLRNDGRPGMLITVEDLLPGDADILRERFGGGVSTAGAATIIEGRGIDIADMSTSPRDAMWIETLSTARDDILAAFGVPMIAFGSSSEKTYDNADAESVSYWTETLVPHMTNLAESYDYLTPGGILDDIYVVHDTSSVHSLQETKRLRTADLRAEVAAGLRTINEYREMTGEQPYDFPEGNVLWIQQSLFPAGAEADVKAIAAKAPPKPGPGEGPQQATLSTGALAKPSRPARTPNAVDIGRPATLRELAQASSDRTLRAIASGQAARPRAASTLVKRPRGHKSAPEPEHDREREHPYLARRTQIEGQVSGAVRAWADRQFRTTGERLGGTKVRRHTRHWVADDGHEYVEVKDLKALDAAYIVQSGRWADDLKNVLHYILKPIIDEEIADMTAEYGIENMGIDVSMLMQVISDMALRRAIAQTGVIELMIQDADQTGKNIQEIRDNLHRLATDLRGWIEPFAVTVTTAAIEAARSAVGERIGRLRKTWHTYGDDRVRLAHRALNGRTVQVRNPFMVGGVKIRYPGDPTAPLNMIINCRCWLEYSPAKEGETSWL